MSANLTKGINLHEVRASVPDDRDAQAAFDYRLKALTWEQMLTADGVRRVILVNELMERGVNIECRVNLAKLRQRIPGATELVVEGPHPGSVMPNSRYAPIVYTFTEQWQPLPAAVAFWFHQAQEFFRELGAEYLDDGYYKQRNQDGEIVLNWREVNVPKVKVLEFRAPADKLGAGPQTATGLALTRVPSRLPAEPTRAASVGLPPGLSLDDIPEIEGAGESALLAAMAPPAATAPAPADTVADDLADLANVIERAARRSPARRPAATPATEEYELPDADDVAPIPRSR